MPPLKPGLLRRIEATMQYPGTTDPISISLILPVYNEGAIIEKVIEAYYRQVLSKFSRTELIVVDDSTDETVSILDNLQKKYDLILIRSGKRLGHGPAVVAGAQSARGDLILFSDSDMQNEPGDFWTLYDKIEDADYVIGYRKKRYDSAPRLILTRLVRLTGLILFRSYLRDANSPFKLIRRPILQKILEMLSQHPITPSIMMAHLVRAWGLSLVEVPVKHMARKKGKCKLSFPSLLLTCLKACCQLLKFRATVGRARRKGSPRSTRAYPDLSRNTESIRGGN